MPVPWRSAVLLLLLAAAVTGSAAGRQLSASTALRAEAPKAGNRTVSVSAAPVAAIVNGWTAARGRYRYMASLRRTNAALGNANTHFCGGTLIHKSVVLTAAHCVINLDTGLPSMDYENRPNVRIGGFGRVYDASSAYELRSTMYTLAHPQFNVPFSAGGSRDYMNYDVALLLLDRPSTMPVLKLIGNKPKPNNPVADNSAVKVVGWGLTTAYGSLAENLQELDMSVLPLSTCAGQWGKVPWSEGTSTNNWATNTMMCAGKNYPYKGYGFCSGDSGGPLIVDGGSAANDRQVGIVSWGPANCGAAENTPYVYTDVGAVFNWINGAVYNLTNEWLVPPTPVVTNPTVTGFDGRARQLTGAANTAQAIAGYPRRWDLAAYLEAGRAKNTNIIQYVSFVNGTLLVEVGVYTSVGALAPVGVTIRGKRTTLAPGKSIKTGAGPVTFAAVKSGAAKTITISQPGVQVVVTQPWSTQKKKWAPWINVQVTISQAPPTNVRLGGQLGSTLPAVSGASFTARKGTVGVTPSAKTWP